MRLAAPHRLSRIYQKRLGTPRARAEWVIRFMQSAARVKTQSAHLRWPPEQLRVELSAFTRGSAEGMADPASMLLSREQARNVHAEVRHLFNEIRDGGSDTEIRLEGWVADVRPRGTAGRLQVRPHLLEMSWRDAFFWRLAEALNADAVRVAFCGKCRTPFVARKAQRYCTVKCAPSGAERNRAYRQRHRARLNEARKARYEAEQKRQGGPNVYIKSRSPRARPEFLGAGGSSSRGAEKEP